MRTRAFDHRPIGLQTRRRSFGERNRRLAHDAASLRDAGSYLFLMGLDSYGAMDAAVIKDSNSDWGKLVRESTQLVDVDLEAPWSNWLLKDVIDATIWDPVG